MDPVEILLVDDKPENLLALEAILTAPGLELVRAESGWSALREIERRDCGLVILDVQMPEMDGFEVARRLHALRPNVPIIFVTAIHQADAFVGEGYACGAVDYLFKPLNAELLKKKVEVFAELHRRRHQLERTVAQLRTPLFSIVGAAESLRKEAEAGKQEPLAAGLSRIESSGRELLSLIEDSLTPSESGS